MESHILNIYHPQRFRSIGHKILRSTSESLSSEGSCQQNSPEYTQDQRTNQYVQESTEGEYWEPTENQGQVWEQTNNENCVTEQSSQDTSSDEEENDIHVEEVSLDTSTFNVNHIDQLDIENLEHESLVEGHDYDIIQVYAVHPDFDLEVSSEDDEQNDCCIGNQTKESEEYYSSEQNKNYNVVLNNVVYNKNETLDICHDNLGINLDTPVVSNVDEYFIKDPKEKNILEVKDRPVVNDVDEYFIKEVKHEQKIPKIEVIEQNTSNIPNVDEFFIKNETPQTDPEFTLPKHRIVGDIFDDPQSLTEDVHSDESIKVEQPADVSINDSDLDVLPNIEEIKKYLLDDIPYMKLKHAQKSCSVPHSPMHSICMDLDAKTCLSFEDLNLDLSDLNFDNDKDKSGNSSKNYDLPRTLTDEDVNSFLITNKSQSTSIAKVEDDLNPQDMEIEGEIGTAIDNNEDVLPLKLDRKCSSTPIPRPTVLEFCIEKSTVKKENDSKGELDDFVDVESCNETVIPVLEANNLNSLLEQFEATENFNSKPKKPVVKLNEQKVKTYNSLANGTRLQDAGVQLNKNKMRQIMMPTTVNTAIRRSPSPVHSDHNYCSSKKRHSLPNLKRGQSLLKPEVLSSNSRILNSRHRSCKNKKIVYNLSSDDESEKCNSIKIKKLGPNHRSHEDKDMKAKKSVVKQPIKATVPSTCRKKASPVHSVLNDVCFDKRNNSVMVNNACKASDNPSSQSFNGSIKLTIKNKSEVIIKNCDDIKDYKKEKKLEKNKTCSVSEKSNNRVKPNSDKSIRNINNHQKKNKIVSTINEHNSVSVKEKLKTLKEPKPEHFYTGLFSNKKDVEIPQAIDVKSQKRSHDDDCTKSTKDTIIKIEVDQPQKKKKLNFQEYKLRRGVSSSSSSATVSPEAIFPDTPVPESIVKIIKTEQSQTPPNGRDNNTEITDPGIPKKIFDPIREASRKILMNTKKQKAEAMRKRDDDIVMSKIPKIENLELQPLISEAEMMKIVGMGSAAEKIPLPIMPEKSQQVHDYDELVLVSIGTNTCEEMFQKIQVSEYQKEKTQTSPVDTKSTINFKIKKSDHILKHNVFDMVQKDRTPTEEKKQLDVKIDKNRFKDITATLKSVEKQVDMKISSNSLFASIQDIVMKKAPEVTGLNSATGEHKSKFIPTDKKSVNKISKTIIVRKYDDQTEHGEDKIILHLEKHRRKPVMITVDTQTELIQKTIKKHVCVTPEKVRDEVLANRKRTDSDMSMSSGSSPDRTNRDAKPAKMDEKCSVKTKTEKRESSGTQTKEKRSNSRERYETKYRRSRSPSRGYRRKRSPSRNRSKSRSRYRRYKRSDSPYRRKRRSRTRSPYRKRRSPSPWREYRNRSPSVSKHAEPVPKSPLKRTKFSPLYESTAVVDKKTALSTTPPLIRKPSVSESSDTSSSSYSSSSSSSSEESVKSRQSSSSSYRKTEVYKKNNYRCSYSPEDREVNTPVEERRIVFVGKLEKDITKLSLRTTFSRFGQVTEVRLHTKEDGSKYGFVTYSKSRDAWAAVEAASSFPLYDVGFGGRRAFCRQSYADLDGLEAKYTESAFHGQATLPARRSDDMSFEQMLLDVKKKLNQRKGDKKRHGGSAP